MHRALFDDGDKSKVNLNAANEPFSISRNLIQRKHETLGGGNNMEINKMFDVKAKFNKDEIDSISLASTNNNMERFNHFITTNDSSKNKTQKLNNHDDVDGGGAQSFSDFFKSIFRCSAAGACNKKKINEQIESDYPLNLHLRMNEIFSMHDKLSDIAENFNDLYSTGRLASLLLMFPSKLSAGEREKKEKYSWILIEIEFPFFLVSFAIREKIVTVFAHFITFYRRRDGDFHNGWLRNDAVRNLFRDKSNKWRFDYFMI